MSIRETYDQELNNLSTALIQMGVAATDALDKAIMAFHSNDNEIANQVIEKDKLIDEMERDIEQRCLRLLLKQQPIAGDLRKVSAAIKMITDIERIGDIATDIAEICLYLDTLISPELAQQINDMARAARSMVSDAIEAYVKENLELARQVIERDDIVDDFFVSIRTQLGKFMTFHNEHMEMAMDYLMIIKYLERVGDHAENISEWVEFCITGIHKHERIL